MIAQTNQYKLKEYKFPLDKNDAINTALVYPFLKNIFVDTVKTNLQN